MILGIRFAYFQLLGGLKSGRFTMGRLALLAFAVLDEHKIFP